MFYVTLINSCLMVYLTKDAPKEQRQSREKWIDTIVWVQLVIVLLNMVLVYLLYTQVIDSVWSRFSWFYNPFPWISINR